MDWCIERNFAGPLMNSLSLITAPCTLYEMCRAETRIKRIPRGCGHRRPPTTAIENAPESNDESGSMHCCANGCVNGNVAAVAQWFPLWRKFLIVPHLAMDYAEKNGKLYDHWPVVKMAVLRFISGRDLRLQLRARCRIGCEAKEQNPHLFL